jgi:hypothetical protein
LASILRIGKGGDGLEDTPPYFKVVVIPTDRDGGAEPDLHMP